MRALRCMRRRFRPVSATLLVAASLLSVGVVAGGLYLSTAHGRAQLIGVVVTNLNRVLPGTFAVGALERLTPTSLTFGRVTLSAGAGNEVLSVERLQVELELMPLLRGQIVASRVSIEGAEVDLR